MLASSFFDAMLGIDIHWEMVPMPAPVPTPIPNPFTGIVKDFTGLAVGLALSNAIGAVMGGSPKGPVLYWGGIPATNTGTNGEHVPGHILIPPGTAWAPVPKTPKPVVRPNENPKPPKPVSPDNDAIIVFGSKTVTVMGTNAVRMGDLAMSCSEPVRLPSTVVMAVPKGAPILIGGPMSLDVAAAIFASLCTRFVGDSLQAGISRLPLGARSRAVLSWIACALTGHPVDVASGKMMTRALDADLPGPLPLTIERFYLSNFASRRGPLGNGWSCSLDQAVWEERGKMVLLAEDGREIEFDTFDFPNHRMRIGDEVWNPINRLTLRREAKDKWRVTAHDGVYREFTSMPEKPDGRARIQRIVSRCEHHDITFTYDGRGRLAWVRDSAGRLIAIEQDEHDRIVALKLPHPHEHGWYVHRRYEYDTEGDLVRAVDSLRNTWSFEYVTHLMVRETDRTGLSFYFEYDGLGEDAWCTRTWGDGGIYDHVINYDKKNHVTYVANSLGHTTQYHMNNMGLVTKVVDAMGGATVFEYDLRTFQVTKEIDPAGSAIEKKYDEVGNLAWMRNADGAEIHLSYDERNQVVRVLDALGGEWRWQYDAFGRLVNRRNPIGDTTLVTWDRGLVAAVQLPGSRMLVAERNEGGLLAAVKDSNGAEIRCSYDRLGRQQNGQDARGGTVQAVRDTEGRVLQYRSRTGVLCRQRFDPEGNLVELEDATRHIHFDYGHFHRLVRRSEGEVDVLLKYDLEGRLLALRNEVGEDYKYTYDPNGSVLTQTGFGGQTLCYERDHAGRVVGVTDATGHKSILEYDSVGRAVRIDHGEGSFSEYEYQRDGLLVRSRNEHGEVIFDRDPLGRMVGETQEGHRVISHFGPDGRRSHLESSLGAQCAVMNDVRGLPTTLYLGKDAVAARTPTIRFNRDAGGIEAARTLPCGIQIQWSYDSGVRPTERLILRQRPGEPRTEVGTRTYRWQGEDQITAILDIADEPRYFDYDARGRLVSERTAHRETSARPVRIGPGETLTNTKVGPGGRVEKSGEFDLTYDAKGRLVSKKRSDGSSWTFHWNGHGLLDRVDRPDNSSVVFEYDSFARRTRKSVVRLDNAGKDEIESEIRFVWDGHVVLHEISQEKGLTTWYWESGTFAPVAKEHAGRVWTVLPDQLGMPNALFNEVGEEVWSADVDLLGRVAVKRGERDDCPWRWPGQYDDMETGLHYNRYRYYDPDIGSYISPDPLGAIGGSNEYSYTDDPLAWADPSGLIQLSQVPYDGHRMFDGPGGVREFLQNTPAKDMKGRNIAAVMLDDGTIITRMSGELGHSEEILLREVDPARVVAAYTERAPCTGRTNCMGLLDEALGKDVPVLYTFEHIRGQEGKTGSEINKARRQACGA